MTDFVFIHGTGTRLASFQATYSLVCNQAAKFLNGVTVHGCFWGDSFGAKLQLHGASIPAYNETSNKTLSQAEAEKINEATWQLLSADPLFEIRLLDAYPAIRQDLSPIETAQGKIAVRLLQELSPSGEFLALLRDKGLDTCWDESQGLLVERREIERILISKNRDPRETSRAVARALIALMLDVARAKGYPEISASTRMHLVNELIGPLGGEALAPFDWITRPLGGIGMKFVRSAATYHGRRARRALTDASFPGIGDILLYQARGDTIRGFIRERIAEIGSDLIVIAHSLGGIAIIELLIQHNLSDRVKGVITVGSQASFLYEIDALVSLRCGEPLPPYFPPWLNFFDPNDFLSYIGEPVFGADKIEDILLHSDLPFPDSHGAYWDLPKFWTEVRRFWIGLT